MKSFLAKFTGDVLAAGIQELATGVPSAVQLDTSGLPIAWRLFPYGPWSLTKDGETLRGEFSQEHGAAIMRHAAQKGTQIPLDSEHGLKLLADKLGVDEAELLPLLNRSKVSMGFGSLALKDDGLWLTDVQWVPLARRIMAEKVLRWFSPVIRGLSTGRLRITSVALTNTPAIDQLDALAASAEEDAGGSVAAPRAPGECPERARFPGATSAALDAPEKSVHRTPAGGVRGTGSSGSPASVSLSTAGGSGSQGRPGPTQRATSPKEKGPSMKGLLTMLGALVCLPEADAAALTAESADTALLPKLQPLIAEIPVLRASKAAHEALLADLRTGLALSAETPAEAVKGCFLSLVEKAKGHDALRIRVDAMELSAETDKRAKLIETGLKAGKLTPDLVAKWAGKQDSVALTAFLEAAPVIVQPGQTIDTASMRQTDVLVLSAEDKSVAKLLGVTEAKFLEQKKTQAPKV